MTWLNRLPLRVRLVAGFALAMAVVLAGAGAFVVWRVEVALDARLDGDLAAQTTVVRDAATRSTPTAALAAAGNQGRDAQLLDGAGSVVAAGPGLTDQPSLLSAPQARAALRGAVRASRGTLFTDRGKRVRVLAVPVDGSAPGGARVAVSAVRLGQRDEALRELLAQLAVANLAALALASLVGYRLAAGALDPVERYRTQAERIAGGATGLRLDVPGNRRDEITRLGGTLNAMLEAQERAAQRQEQFVADASHDLRTPLSALTAEVELALRRPRSTVELTDALRRVGEDAERLTALADELLTLSALGSIAPAAEPVRVRDHLAAAATRAHAQLRDKMARTVAVEAPHALRVHADAALLARALGNLVDNAVRHGAGAITLGATPLTDSAGGGCLIYVHDQGPGIDPAFLPHAHERFRRDTTSRAGRGPGLGLAVVEAIAAAHHGQLRVCSGAAHHHVAGDPLAAQVACQHPGSGTTVSLVLPDVAAPIAAVLN